MQDWGRFGYQDCGVPVSGAMDRPAMRIGNILVGNDEGEAGIEITLGGFKAEFLSDMVIAVTGVETSHDLRTARVYISHLGTEADKKATMSAITAASGFFRKELANNLRLRRVPELSFHWDDSIERGAHIEELIDRVNSEKERERDN